MEFVEVIKAKERMHKAAKACARCPLGRTNNGTGLFCDEFIKTYPEKAEELIMKWTKEHPIKTNGDHFLDEYPKAHVSGWKCIRDKNLT